MKLYWFPTIEAAADLYVGNSSQAFPAFLGGSIVMMPINFIIPTLPEAAEPLPTGALALLLSYWVAAKLEWYSAATRWALLGIFLALSITGAMLPLGYTGWSVFGAHVWCVATLLLRRAWQNVKTRPPQLT